MSERYELLPLNAPDSLHGNLAFHALRDDNEGFRILVNLRPHQGGPDLGLIIRFDNPIAYRSADEGKRLKTLATLGVTCGLYRVHGANLAQWLSDESGYLDEASLPVYAIVTTDDWIEVVTNAPPILHWQV